MSPGCRLGFVVTQVCVALVANETKYVEVRFTGHPEEDSEVEMQLIWVGLLTNYADRLHALQLCGDLEIQVNLPGIRRPMKLCML